MAINARLRSEVREEVDIHTHGRPPFRHTSIDVSTIPSHSNWKLQYFDLGSFCTTCSDAPNLRKNTTGKMNCSHADGSRLQWHRRSEPNKRHQHVWLLPGARPDRHLHRKHRHYTWRYSCRNRRAHDYDSGAIFLKFLGQNARHVASHTRG